MQFIDERKRHKGIVKIYDAPFPDDVQFYLYQSHAQPSLIAEIRYLFFLKPGLKHTLFIIGEIIMRRLRRPQSVAKVENQFKDELPF